MADKKQDKEVLLIEYQKAQDSAEHHDNLVWTTSSVIIAGMLVLIGFSLGYLKDPYFKDLILSIGILGIFLSVFLLYTSWTSGWVKNQKYERCKEIEEKFGMVQHSKLKYPKYIQRILFSIIILIFIIVWIHILRMI